MTTEMAETDWCLTGRRKSKGRLISDALQWTANPRVPEVIRNLNEPPKFRQTSL